MAFIPRPKLSVIEPLTLVLLRATGSAFSLHALASGDLAGHLFDPAVSLVRISLLPDLLQRGESCRLVLLARCLPRVGVGQDADGGLEKRQVRKRVIWTGKQELASAAPLAYW